MEGNKEGKTKYVFDESMLDPRLRTDSAKMLESESNTNTQAASSGPESSPTGLTGTTPALAPFPAYVPEGQGEAWWNNFEDDIMDQDTVFPESPYKSLDYIIDSGDLRDDERTWLMGMQAGIGLGIHCAREAVLNEMQNENTVFKRQMQRHPSDPDPFQLRMELGRECEKGFDIRVAYRAGNRYIRSLNQVADTVVYHGLTDCLPGTGNHFVGTSMLFSDEDVARCRSNYRIMSEAARIAASQPQPSLGVDGNSSTDQPAPLTASFLGDGKRIGNVDMTRLTGTAALIANAFTYNPVPPSGQHMARGRPNPDVASLSRELPPWENKDEDVEVKSIRSSYMNKGTDIV
ncbi:hypothetical protein F5B22DRAFT_599577 [Xylaria bambusicola]|uniref:uncharacterized protein n=1 Tax=Xylaria bambusicola TaxID=326684 RepID=UPI002008A649|nr:uncharacterized protein F5B22DRAFT_599577 [Xylaria bambusicola]KAI0518530.1 hypothetical protein F5B22DRAFT_599577 [Xylaria bambusicola]